jgi:NADH:ubiquinone oxidoreductase subunit F (NADH-binding)/NADH:ubiquinone oxidoreductase subunit E
LKLLRELSQLQHEQGFLPNKTLQELSRRRRVPLYVLEGLVSFYPAFRRTPPPKRIVRVCRDICCAMAARGCLDKQLAERHLDHEEVEVHQVSCLGRCDSAPAVSVNDTPLSLAILPDFEDLLDWIADAGQVPIETTGTPPRRWKCDPYEDTAAHYGTIRALISPGADLRATCIERLQESQLCGMGGAGFPTGRKWSLVANEVSETKYVICNADESEPGTFKDRVILAELPHLVIEGMILAGLTIGAAKGIVYLRHEYGPEQRALEAALTAARDKGLLGSDAGGSGQAFEIEVFVSPGGYILGEETALLEALEDRRGEPRNKPPYPGTYGLWGKPTLINNVETFALATSIVHHGSDWWQAQGKPSFAGLKFCSISGDIEHPGVYEIPLGTTVAELIELAGGMQGDKALKAFLPGGASSNFLTAAHVDTPIDFQTMKQAGSMLGTGAVIVMAEDRDLFALATNLVRFFRNESCGKCVPCREGSERAVQLLEHAQGGGVSHQQLSVLPDLGETLEQTSICGLGQVALNPILSMMKHFPDEIPCS